MNKFIFHASRLKKKKILTITLKHNSPKGLNFLMSQDIKGTNNDNKDNKAQDNKGTK